MSKTWSQVPLGAILTERQEVPSDSSLTSGETPIVAKIGFDDGRIQLRTDGRTKTGMILIRPGDLVISGINAAKGAIAIYGEENTRPIAATIHYGAYIPNKARVDISFLWWLLRSRTFRNLLLEYVPGGIKTELKAKRFLPVPIPLPPFVAEQRRIVARIEAMSAEIKDARTIRLETTKEAEALLGSSITRAVSGIPIDGHLSDVLLEKPRNGWSARCDNAETGIPVLTLGAVTGFRYREKEFKKTSEPTAKETHYWLKSGDLLITRSNAPELVGHAAIYNGTPCPCIYPDLMMRLVVNETRADKRFVHCWLRSVPVREYIGGTAKGTSPTMKKISQGTVMNIPFPTKLPVPEQRRIVHLLDDLQAKVDALKKFQAETSAELEALLPSILDRAFTGQL